MALVKGPFNIKWGDVTLTDVEEVDVSFEQESNDYTTVDGRTITVKGAISASASITLLSSDVKTLSALLPQFTKTDGQTMSSKETVAEGAVAIDILAGDCTTAAQEPQDLDIIACGNPAEVFRIKSTTTSISEFVQFKLPLPVSLLKVLRLSKPSSTVLLLIAVSLIRPLLLIDSLRHKKDPFGGLFCG